MTGGKIRRFPEVMEIEAYVYTAGPIGSRWLEELRRGRLTAGYCAKCGKLFIPPRSFDPDSFEEVSELMPIDEVGIVETYTVIYRDFYGNPLREPATLAFIRFPGVEGGLIHFVKAKEQRVGMRVRPKWRPPEERKGLITDIEYFEPV
ncbi:MAG: Zn-ribbon domain-containing OB-fold protein [Thermoproteus sp.]|nr:Zn-ribbon domain-containing OB-fold protein [Thermoproteus sp.]